MKSFKSHFVFNRSQRNGILLLVLIIVVLQVGYFFIDFSSEELVSPQRQEEIARFQKQVDSLKRATALQDSIAIFPFNPNYITDYKGYTLGMSVEEIDRLHAYRAQDKWVNSAEDFQKVTGVSDSLLNTISPYFNFPQWVQNSPIQSKPPVERQVSTGLKKDLNGATAEDLQEINGIGEVLSQRIVNFRESIGGFNHEIQLLDVYGLTPEVVARTGMKFVVFEPVRERQDINQISLIALSELPYFNYELARKVIDLRNKKGKITSFEELTDLKGFPPEKIERIELYLSID